MSWGSSYDRNRDLGHSTARARADADAAAQKALERERAARRAQEQLKPAPSWVTPPHWATPIHMPNGSISQMGPAESFQHTLPTAPPAKVSYPREQDLSGFHTSSHPEIHGLFLGHRAHPFTGEKILEIMWEGVLPRGREFIPISLLGKKWSGVRTQGVTLPMEVRRDGGSFALRWLPPSPASTTRLQSSGDLKVMLGLPGADKRPTFTLLPGSTESSLGTDGGSPIPDLIAKAAAVALITGVGAAAAWWNNRGRRNN